MCTGLEATGNYVLLGRPPAHPKTSLDPSCDALRKRTGGTSAISKARERRLASALTLKLTITRRFDDIDHASPSLHGGAVAQLGERVNGIDEVRGSNPLSSTKFPTTHALDSSLTTPNLCASTSPKIRTRLSSVGHATNGGFDGYSYLRTSAGAIAAAWPAAHGEVKPSREEVRSVRKMGANHALRAIEYQGQKTG